MAGRGGRHRQTRGTRAGVIVGVLGLGLGSGLGLGLQLDKGASPDSAGAGSFCADVAALLDEHLALHEQALESLALAPVTPESAERAEDDVRERRLRTVGLVALGNRTRDFAARHDACLDDRRRARVAELGLGAAAGAPSGPPPRPRVPTPVATPDG